MRLTTIAFTVLGGMAQANDIISYETAQSFDDVVFGLENAILGQGLVVDSVHSVGDMLERTRTDVGSDVVIYRNAQVFSFCSAIVSRKMMEADPLNIAYCPYDIFVMVTDDRSDVTTIGFQRFPEGPMKEVEDLLDYIARTAIGLD
ncbi:Uncharacterized conserved protein, DUF302 family [Roseivivax lentus]|uniref:Uncharacterized conserved protein, DUF302 family n=1 Tax=Roseivivax lentus TaxID=633194 RepID=A0A1N7JJI5_9RHOB|nr:DUF302 domain-containing protein [Roseivivax lentus]SIS49487.1 Uncharacterized conserved protein, DUF302 family [Roseivivax lentus]